MQMPLKLLPRTGLVFGNLLTATNQFQLTDFGSNVLENHPPKAEPLGMDFTCFGSERPDARPFFTNQFDQPGNLCADLRVGLRVARTGSFLASGSNVF
jgi:hypothetical protein